MKLKKKDTSKNIPKNLRKQKENFDQGEREREGKKKYNKQTYEIIIILLWAINYPWNW